MVTENFLTISWIVTAFSAASLAVIDSCYARLVTQSLHLTSVLSKSHRTTPYNHLLLSSYEWIYVFWRCKNCQELFDSLYINKSLNIQKPGLCQHLASHIGDLILCSVWFFFKLHFKMWGDLCIQAFAVLCDLIFFCNSQMVYGVVCSMNRERWC